MQRKTDFEVKRAKFTNCDIWPCNLVFMKDYNLNKILSFSRRRTFHVFKCMANVAFKYLLLEELHENNHCLQRKLHNLHTFCIESAGKDIEVLHATP